MKEILDIIHKTIYQFFDVCGDDEEVPMSDKIELLLEINKAICDNLKALEQEPFMNKACVSNKVCEHDKKVVLDKIRAEISKTWHTHPQSRYEEGLKDQALRDIKIIDRYTAGSEGE